MKFAEQKITVLKKKEIEKLDTYLNLTKELKKECGPWRQYQL